LSWSKSRRRRSARRNPRNEMRSMVTLRVCSESQSSCVILDASLLENMHPIRKSSWFYIMSDVAGPGHIFFLHYCYRYRDCHSRSSLLKFGHHLATAAQFIRYVQ
jgi:hypothetical protein